MHQPQSQETAVVPPSPQLARVLGARDATAIMVSNMIGMGILTLPGIVAVAFGNITLALVFWVLGGLVSLAGALVQAELGCRFPHAGGDYIFLREAYGPGLAFMSGWTSFVIGFPGAIALDSVGAARFLFDAMGYKEADVGHWGYLALAMALLLGLSSVHAFGLRSGRWVQNILVLLKISILGTLVAGGFFVAGKGGGPVPEGGPPFAIGALIILFTYSGWNSAAYVAGEIREPRRSLPRAMIGGVLIVTVLYLAWAWTCYRLVPASDLAKIDVGSMIAGAIFGEGGGRVMSIALAVVLLGSASAMIITGPRIYYAMSRDRLFPSSLSAVGSGSLAPVRALWLQTVWAAGILVLGTVLTPDDKGVHKTFEMIADWTAFSILPFAALTCASVFILRKKGRSDGDGTPFATPGYPWTAVFFVAAVLAVVVTTASKDALVGAIFVGSGVPVYLFWKLRNRNGRGGA
jgi:basic amino acid/polyamine antiporter, APA family